MGLLFSISVWQYLAHVPSLGWTKNHLLCTRMPRQHQRFNHEPQRSQPLEPDMLQIATANNSKMISIAISEPDSDHGRIQGKHGSRLVTMGFFDKQMPKVRNRTWLIDFNETITLCIGT